MNIQEELIFTLQNRRRIFHELASFGAMNFININFKDLQEKIYSVFEDVEKDGFKFIKVRSAGNSFISLEFNKISDVVEEVKGINFKAEFKVVFISKFMDNVTVDSGIINI